MSVRVLNHKHIERLVNVPRCLELIERAMVAHARGDTIQPLRSAMPLPNDKGVLGVLPGYLGDPACFGAKVLSIFPGNTGTDYGSHQGVVLLFEPEHGSPVAILEGRSITALRTAAATGVATRWLARDNATILGMLGCGDQADAHLDAMLAVRPISKILIWSRSIQRARRFAELKQEQHEVETVAVAAAEEAVGGADIVCTTTSSAEPLVHGAWLQPGMHINAIGAAVRENRELDSEAVRRARLYVDDLQAAADAAGDIVIARAEGAIDDSHVVGEIGEVVLGDKTGRTSDDDITLYKSVGIGVHDLAMAHYLHRKALEADIGVDISL